MIFLSTVLACLLIGSGLSAVFIGSGMVVLERGWSMVISGSVVATGGVLLLGITMLIHELRRLPERLADMLPEAPPDRAHAEADAFVDYPPLEDGYAARRPRLDPEPAQPERSVAAGPFFADPQFSASDAKIPADMEADVGARASRSSAEETDRDRPDANGSSALKIQISLHGQSEVQAPPPGHEAGGLAPIVEAPRREAGSDGGGRGRPFWSRFGRSEKAAAASTPDPAADKDDDEPRGPTAAERARERLALADTPESGGEKTAPSSQAQDAAPEAPDRPETGHLRSMDNDSAAGRSARQESMTEVHSTEANVPAEDAPSSVADNGETPSGADDATPAVVGSYRAAGNLYVMYDNGSIEAETPGGIFRFTSLDKLKAYIASGEDPALAGPRVERPPTSGDRDPPPSDAERDAAG